MLTAHIPLAGPSERGGGERAPPFGPARLDIQLPAAEAREGACGMILSPLLAPPRQSRLLGWLGAAVGRRDPWSRAARANAQAFTDAQAVSRSWTAAGPEAAGGTASVFDTSFQHTAYNDGEQPADILFIDFYHPELTEAEEAAVRILQKLLRARGEVAYAPSVQ